MTQLIPSNRLSPDDRNDSARTKTLTDHESVLGKFSHPISSDGSLPFAHYFHSTSMKKLRGGHIIVAVVPAQHKSKATVVTFKKVRRKGRRSIYKIENGSSADRDITPPTPAPPSPQPRDLVLDESFISLYQDDEPQDSGEALGQDNDVKLPRQATVSKCFFFFFLHVPLSHSYCLV